MTAAKAQAIDFSSINEDKDENEETAMFTKVHAKNEMSVTRRIFYYLNWQNKSNKIKNDKLCQAIVNQLSDCEQQFKASLKNLGLQEYHDYDQGMNYFGLYGKAYLATQLDKRTKEIHENYVKILASLVKRMRKVDRNSDDSFAMHNFPLGIGIDEYLELCVSVDLIMFAMYGKSPFE